MCSLDVGPGRRKQKLEDHRKRQGHQKRLKVVREKELQDEPSSGNIPIPLLVYFGLVEEHMDTRAHIAPLAPLPPASRGLYPHISAVGGQGREIGRTEAWGGDGSPSPRPPVLTSLSRIARDTPSPLLQNDLENHTQVLLEIDLMTDNSHLGLSACTDSSRSIRDSICRSRCSARFRSYTDSCTSGSRYSTRFRSCIWSRRCC